MSLAWFPFNIKDFLANTKRLNTEAKGAYLLLMLDYYEQGQPPPDDDAVLATIAELPLEAWQRHRKVLAPLFRIEEGFWRHDRIERERLEAGSKLARSHARAKAAGDAYAAKIADQKLQAGSKPDPKPKKANEPISKPAPSRLQADPEPIPKTTHLHLHLSKTLSTESARDAIEEEKGTGALDPPVHQSEDDDPDLGIGTPIDRLFQLNANQLATCKFDGATPEIIEAERVTFISRHLEKGTFSNDWDASWAIWWQRWKEYVAKQAEAAERAAERIAKREREKATTLPARVEVNNVIDWDKHCAFWVKVGRWSRDLGPDPDSPACRCPLEILIKHKLRKESVS